MHSHRHGKSDPPVPVENHNDDYYDDAFEEIEEDKDQEEDEDEHDHLSPSSDHVSEISSEVTVFIGMMS